MYRFGLYVERKTNTQIIFRNSTVIKINKFIFDSIDTTLHVRIKIKHLYIKYSTIYHLENGSNAKKTTYSDAQ